jgi:hypothetical protein
MRYSEFKRWPSDKRKNFIDSLEPEERRDFNDALTFSLPEFKPVDDKHYFDDIDEYVTYLTALNAGRMVLNGLTPDQIRSHELAHARVALKLGAKSVKFYLEVTPMGREHGAYTAAFGPLELPNIAYAAITAAPLQPSAYDISQMQPTGYPSVDYLSQRIHKWNKEDHGLVIPMPGELETR